MKEEDILLDLITVLSDGEFHSRRRIKESLDIDDQSVIDDYVKILSDWGIDTLFISEKGYRISNPIQLLDATLIEEQVGQGHVFVIPVIDSTNRYLLDHLNTLCSGDVCVSEYQKDGYGRRGNKWISPFGSNLCFSIYWNFKDSPNLVIKLSLVISIVMAEIFHEIGVNQVRVKWPNDLYLFDRKLGGVLVEIRNKNSNATQIVIGVGINLAMRSVQTQEIEQEWINLQEINVIIDRNMLIVRMIKALRSSLRCFERDGFIPFLSRLKNLSNFINRPVKLVYKDQDVIGISRGIDDQGALLLEQNGVINPWISEEVSLRNMKENIF